MKGVSEIVAAAAKAVAVTIAKPQPQAKSIQYTIYFKDLPLIMIQSPMHYDFFVGVSGHNDKNIQHTCKAAFSMPQRAACDVQLCKLRLFLRDFCVSKRNVVVVFSEKCATTEHRLT